jgi:hypothetical protein
MLLIETQKKKKAKSEWKESLNRRDLLNIETVEDFAEVANRGGKSQMSFWEAEGEAKYFLSKK